MSMSSVRLVLSFFLCVPWAEPLLAQFSSATVVPGLPQPWQGPFEPHPHLIVNLATGNMTTRFVTSRFYLLTVEPHHELEFLHNSGAVNLSGDFSGGFALGPGWSSTVGGKLTFPTSDRADLVLADGTLVEFEKQPDGRWQTDDWWRLTLEADGSDWLVRTHAGWVSRYAASGLLSSVTSDAGNAYVIARTSGRPTQVTDPVGRNATFAYDAASRVTSITDSDGYVFTFSYDAAGRLASFVHPTAGSLSLTYDAKNRVRAYTGYDGGTWSVTYWASGPKSNRVKTVVDPDGGQYTFDYVFAASTVTTTVTDPRGGVSEVVHDREDSPALESACDPEDNTWTYVHDVSRLLASRTSPTGRTWTYTHDTGGNLLSATDGMSHSVSYTYDTSNNLTSITRAGQTISLSYEDPLLPTRVTRVQVPDPGGTNATSIHEYYHASDSSPPGRWNGLLKRTVDPTGAEARYTYDQIGMLIAEEEGPPSASGRVEVRYDQGPGLAYVDHGGMTYPASFPTVPADPTMVQGRLTEFPAIVHTWRGDLEQSTVSVQVPIAAGSGWEDSSWSQAFEHDALGRTTRVDEETDEPLEHVANPGAPTITRTILRTFDDTGPDGVVTVTMPDGDVLTIERDLAGRPERLDSSDLGAGALGFDLVHDGNDDLEDVLRDDGTTTHYEYTANGLVEVIEHRDGGTLVLRLDLTYDARDLPLTQTETTPTDTVVKTYVHDLRQRMTRETRTSTVDPVDAIAYTYDLVGNRTTRARSVGGSLVETDVYHYDSENPAAYASRNHRLMWIEHRDGSGQLVSTTWLFYDNPFGNVSHIVRSDAGSGSYSASCFLYTNTGQPWLAWEETWSDATGGPQNVTRGTVLEVRTFFGATRAWRLRDGSTFAPLADAEWVTQWNGSEASFSVDDQDGSVTRGDLALAGGDRLTSSGPAYDLVDHLFSVRATSTSGGISRQETTAFGVPAGTLGAPSAYGFAGAFLVRQRALGQPITETRVALMGHRFYAAELGRFVMRDPMGLRDGPSPYVFAHNQPTAQVDPTGLAAQQPRRPYPGPQEPPPPVMQPRCPLCGQELYPPPPPPWQGPPRAPSERPPLILVPKDARWRTSSELGGG